MDVGHDHAHEPVGDVQGVRRGDPDRRAGHLHDLVREDPADRHEAPDRRVRVDHAERSPRGADLALSTRSTTTCAIETLGIQNPGRVRPATVSTGKLTLTGENGLTIEYDGGVAAGNFDDTVGVDWATVATANPIGDLRTIVAAVQAQSSDGSGPIAAIISDQVFGYLQQNAKMAALFRGDARTPRASSPRTRSNSIFRAYGLPPMVTYDARAVAPPVRRA